MSKLSNSFIANCFQNTFIKFEYLVQIFLNTFLIFNEIV